MSFPPKNVQSRPQHPSESYYFWQVFLQAGEPTLTFVEREDFEKLKNALAQPGRGVVIEGPSGIGKTTAVRKAVQDLKSSRVISSSDIQILSARGDTAEQRKIATLPDWHTGTIIVDDFHRLDAAVSEKLVNHLKYLADNSPTSRKLVIVGIPRTHERLINISFDLALRIKVFKFGPVEDKLVLQMIEKGEQALNIEFDLKDEIVRASNGSLNVAQSLCYFICERIGIKETQDQRQVIRCDVNAASSDLMSDLSMKFEQSITHFASLGGQKDSTSFRLLEELAQSKDGFLSLISLQNKKPTLSRGIQRFIDEHWIDILYNEVPNAQYFLFFDQALQALVIDDPQLSFYLKQLRLPDFAKRIGKSPALGQRRVFVSYSHKDARWLQRLQVHLKPLEREGISDLWDDTKIAIGAPWKEEILEAVETASAAIILISADFLASEFVSQYELPRFLTQAESVGTRIIPVIVSPCSFEDTALARFQAANPPSRPLSEMTFSEQEQVFANIVSEIRKIFAT